MNVLRGCDAEALIRPGMRCHAVAGAVRSRQHSAADAVIWEQVLLLVDDWALEAAVINQVDGALV